MRQLADLRDVRHAAAAMVGTLQVTSDEEGGEIVEGDTGFTAHVEGPQQNNTAVLYSHTVCLDVTVTAMCCFQWEFASVEPSCSGISSQRRGSHGLHCRVARREPVLGDA